MKSTLAQPRRFLGEVARVIRGGPR